MYSIKLNSKYLKYKLLITLPLLLAVLILLAWALTFTSILTGLETLYIALIVVLMVIAIYFLAIVPITNHFLFKVNTEGEFLTITKGTLLKKKILIKKFFVNYADCEEQVWGNEAFKVVIKTDSDTFTIKYLTKEEADYIVSAVS